MAVYVTTGKTYDESRNTSRVRGPDPENSRRLRALLARSYNEPWYRWIEDRRDGRHDHHAVRANGERAACPVVGCTAELDP
jgi:hypothetical protein